MTTAYYVLLFAVAVQRVLELRNSRLNEAELAQRGGIEHAHEQMPVMIAVHSAWLVFTSLEVLLFDRPFYGLLTAVAMFVFALGQTLRLLAMRELGRRWTVTVFTVPGESPVTSGIFRYLRHPNYLGVVLEIAALPLIHGAWLSALLFSAANGVLLSRRIKAEERALAASSDYAERFANRPRLVPKVSGPEDHP